MENCLRVRQLRICGSDTEEQKGQRRIICCLALPDNAEVNKNWGNKKGTQKKEI